MKLEILNGKDPGDDRAVSPVVGVALLIAITVILAAVIGFVVLDQSTTTTDAPTARMNFNLQSDEIVHEGGDTFNASNVEVRINGDGDDLTNSSNFAAGDSFNTGDKIDVTEVADTTSSGDTVTVVWTDPDSDREVNLGQATKE